MIDKNEFLELENSIELEFFIKTCSRHIDAAKDQLTKKYNNETHSPPSPTTKVFNKSLFCIDGLLKFKIYFIKVINVN